MRTAPRSRRTRRAPLPGSGIVRRHDVVSPGRTAGQTADPRHDAGRPNRSAVWAMPPACSGHGRTHGVGALEIAFDLFVRHVAVEGCTAPQARAGSAPRTERDPDRTHRPRRLQGRATARQCHGAQQHVGPLYGGSTEEERRRSGQTEPCPQRVAVARGVAASPLPCAKNEHSAAATAPAACG